ncbi:hypothetical protein ACPFP2_00715 [Micromonospora citrea]|uniref:hypothetical protein n=1 Tax=Micromonospora citrea TaxID=47855 RepID=UPI003C686A2C
MNLFNLTVLVPAGRADRTSMRKLQVRQQPTRSLTSAVIPVHDLVVQPNPNRIRVPTSTILDGALISIDPVAGVAGTGGFGPCGDR